MNDPECFCPSPDKETSGSVVPDVGL